MTEELLIQDDEVERIVRDLGIPPCPEILTRLLREMREDEADFIKIGNLISGDVSLAAATLKTVNSPFFGLRSKLSSLHQALNVLGLRNVKQIVTGLLLRNALPTGDSATLKQFWDTSSGIAQTNAMLAKPLGSLDPEEAYVFALFRDCGIPLMVRRFATYDAFYAGAVAASQSLTQAEQAGFRVNHARVGARLARTWQLPDHVCEAIAQHHEYEALAAGNFPRPVSRLVALTLVSEYVYTRCTSGGDCPAWIQGGVFALETLQIDPAQVEAQIEMLDGILDL